MVHFHTRSHPEHGRRRKNIYIQLCQSGKNLFFLRCHAWNIAYFFAFPPWKKQILSRFDVSAYFMLLKHSKVNINIFALLCYAEKPFGWLPGKIGRRRNQKWTHFDSLQWNGIGIDSLSKGCKKTKSYADEIFVYIAFFVIFIDKIKYLNYNINR